MQNEQETLSALERRIEIAVPLADIEKAAEAKLKRMMRTIKMPGFRPGKVPYKLVEQNYGGQARSEAIGEVVERSFAEQVRAQNLRVAGYPRIEPKKSENPEVLEFVATFEVYPEVVIGDFASQKLERPVLTVGEAEVDKTIEVLRKQRTVFEPADRGAEANDRVVIDFVGRKDGEVFEGGQAQDFPFIVGAGQMLEDFDAAVRGLKSGESKTFDMSFPEDYHAKHLAGQAVQFEVSMKKVEAPRLPEVDGDFARTLGVADGDIAKMREEVKANLEREVKRRISARMKDQVMQVLLDLHPIELPKALVEAEAQQLVENARRDMESRGMRTKDLPIDPSWFRPQAERRVKLGLILAELVKKEGLYAKPEQVRALVEEFAQSYEDPAEVVKWYYSQPDRMAQAEALVIEDNVVNWVYSKAQTEDKEVSFDELMGAAAEA